MNNRLKKIAYFSLPVCANNLINILGTIIGVIFVAHLGVTEIAAMSMASSLYIALLTIATTTSYATSIMVGHANSKLDEGQGNSDVARIFKSANIAVMMLSLPVSMVLWHGDTLLSWAGQPESLTKLTQSYFHFAALSLFPTNLSMVNGQLCIGLGKPNISFVFSIIRLVLTCIVSYGLILGKLSMPKLGITGVTATVFFVQIFVCLLTYAFFKVSPSFKKLNLFNRKNFFHLKSIGEFYRLGLPIGVQFGGELAAIFVNTMMLGHLGVNALAASQVASQYGLLLIMIVLGVSQTLSVFTSINHASNNQVQIKQDTVLGIQLLTMVFVGLGVIFFVSYKPLISVYFDINAVKNHELFHLTLVLLILRWFTLYVDGLRNLLSGVLRGMKQSHYPMQIGLYCLWLISIPCAYLGGFVLHAGVVGLAIGFMSGFVVATIVLWLRLARNEAQQPSRLVLE